MKKRMTPDKLHHEAEMAFVRRVDGIMLHACADAWTADRNLLQNAIRELAHLVALLEPLERDGRLNVPGMATLNGARAAIAKATPEAKS